MKNKQPFNYEEAMAELEAILARMQDGRIGLEQMQDETARAVELIRLCRGRLREIGSSLDQLLDSAEETPADA